MRKEGKRFWEGKKRGKYGERGEEDLGERGEIERKIDCAGLR